MYASDATNLVVGDTNGKRDIYLRDTVARKTLLVSKPRAGQSNGASFGPTVSDDGRYIAFLSDASNLVAGDTNGKTDAFRVDLTSGAIIRVSVGVGNKQSNGATLAARMSANGASIAFSSSASNLVVGDTNGAADIYLRDLSQSAPRRISNAGGGVAPSISPDGKRIAFLAAGRSANTDGVVWTRSTGVLQRICYGYQGDTSAGTATEIIATNGGAACATDNDTNGPVYREVKSTASPSSLSFTDGDAEASWEIGYLDATTWGASVVDVGFNSTGDPQWRLVDKTGVLAVLPGGPQPGVAVAGPGNYVAYRLGPQVVVWNRANHTNVTASTS